MQTSSLTLYHRLAIVTLCLTFVVILLGAYVRLSDAGLGCPDWPGCYGSVVVPDTPVQADQAYPNRPLHEGKAWREMIHRYAAGTLGLLILALTALAWTRHRTLRGVTTATLAFVVFQALLGMWTVTLLLKPLVVTGHLLGGMTILSLMLLCVLASGERLRDWWSPSPVTLRWVAGIGLVVLALQVFLGAWTSTNYAGLACPDFPTCLGQWWPKTDYGSAYTLWHGLPINYEHGILNSVARATIHWTHRLGAIVTLVVMLAVAGCMAAAGRTDRRWGWLALLLVLAVLVQVGLGITTVLLHLPVAIADAHNGGAAFLLMVVIAVNFAAWRSVRL